MVTFITTIIIIIIIIHTQSVLMCDNFQNSLKQTANWQEVIKLR
jgi:hypothetical protein